MSSSHSFPSGLREPWRREGKSIEESQGVEELNNYKHSRTKACKNSQSLCGQAQGLHLRSQKWEAKWRKGPIVTQKLSPYEKIIFSLMVSLGIWIILQSRSQSQQWMTNTTQGVFGYSLFHTVDSEYFFFSFFSFLSCFFLSFLPFILFCLSDPLHIC